MPNEGVIQLALSRHTVYHPKSSNWYITIPLVTGCLLPFIVLVRSFSTLQSIVHEVLLKHLMKKIHQLIKSALVFAIQKTAQSQVLLYIFSVLSLICFVICSCCQPKIVLILLNCSMYCHTRKPCDVNVKPETYKCWTKLGKC